MNTTKRKIRVAFGRNPPDAFDNCLNFPTMNPSIDCLYPGWIVEIVQMLADYLKIDVEPVEIPDEMGNINWGYNINGTFNGVLGMLQEDKIDTMCTLFEYISDHVKIFSYSRPVRNIYITHPKRKSISMSLWNAFFPYETSVWVILLVLLGLQGMVATFITKVEYIIKMREYFSPVEKFWQYLRLQIHQAIEFETPFFLQSGNLSFILYVLIQATLFTNLYTAVLLSALIQGQNPRPWDSYYEMVSLVKSGEYSMVMDQLDFEEGSHLRNLREALIRNPIVIANSVFEALDFVEKGGYIFPTKQDSLALQLSKERCNLFYYEDEQMQDPKFFIFNKNSSFLRDWNIAIRDNMAFIRHTFDKYFQQGYHIGRIPKCSDNTYYIREASHIISTFGIFMIALIGYGTSIIVFIFELYVDSKALRFRLHKRTRLALLTAPLQLMSILRFFSRNEQHQIRQLSVDLRRRVMERTETEDAEIMSQPDKNLKNDEPLTYQWRKRKTIPESLETQSTVL